MAMEAEHRKRSGMQQVRTTEEAYPLPPSYIFKTLQIVLTFL
jgi:hypothetical protein